MFKLLMNGLLSLLMGIVNIVLAPINAILGALFPDLGGYLIGVITFLGQLGSAISYISNLFPPLFKGLIVITLTTLIYYYTIYWTYTALYKAWSLIQKIKLW